MERSAQHIKSIREKTGMNRREFSEYFGIPLRTLQDWEYDKRTPPEYVVRLLAYRVKCEELKKLSSVECKEEKRNQKVLITLDDNGKQLVVIPQVLFKGKRNISWEKVEQYLIRYIDDIFTVAETEDIIFVGKDFADEYCGSEYTRKLKGALPKTKANMAQGIPEMIQIASGKRWKEDFDGKHGNSAKNGWYRYNTRFALPVLNEKEVIESYNVYQAVLIVRYASDDKLYLYDIQNIKKETRCPS